jgi:hypothetical protein
MIIKRVWLVSVVQPPRPSPLSNQAMGSVPESVASLVPQSRPLSGSPQPRPADTAFPLPPPLPDADWRKAATARSRATALALAPSHCTAEPLRAADSSSSRLYPQPLSAANSAGSRLGPRQCRQRCLLRNVRIVPAGRDCPGCRLPADRAARESAANLKVFWGLSRLPSQPCHVFHGWHGCGGRRPSPTLPPPKAPAAGAVAFGLAAGGRLARRAGRAHPLPRDSVSLSGRRSRTVNENSKCRRAVTAVAQAASESCCPPPPAAPANTAAGF